MFTIKDKTVRKYNRKTKQYDRVVSLFSKYKVTSINETEVGRVVEITGPKQNFKLWECNKPLTKIMPPTRDGENAIQKKMPLFFVMGTGMNCTKIQGATYFALDGDVLIPYRSSGRNTVEEL